MDEEVMKERRAEGRAEWQTSVREEIQRRQREREG